MRHVVFRMEGFDEHVVDVDLHSLTELFGEHPVHESLVSCAGAFEAEGHYLVAISSAIGNESIFLAIVGVHHNLIVT